ncbi:MAG: hypothetical protein ACD_79C01527G0001 [uncultured bacterium]|nr:MAG: hypothetical protein ACD_79C01527G0001 [uncultured bacterium]
MFHPINHDNNYIITAATHDGDFHADEVVAISLIKLAYQKIKIIRSRDPKILGTADFMLDVGGIYDPSIRKFDHHQKNYSGTLATAGMVLEWLRNEGVLDTKFANYLKNIFIKGVDMQDNGDFSSQRGFCTFSDVIRYFNPLPPATEEEYHKCFHKALEFTSFFFERLKSRYIHNRKHKKKFLFYLHKKKQPIPGILILNENIPWKEYIFEENDCYNIKLVIFPVNKNKWILHTVSKSLEKPFSSRLKLPNTWAGLLDQDFGQTLGIKEAIFCHKRRFMAVFKTKKAALNAGLLALNHKKEDPLTAVS